jgi:CBS domain-containing protein
MARLTVGDVMTRDVRVVRRSTPLKEIARQLDEYGISAMPVLDDDDRLLGVVSETDIVARELHPAGDGRHRWWRRAPAARGGAAKDLMTTPVITVTPHTDIPRAARMMESRGVRRLVVVDPEDRLVGVVSRSDLVRVYLRDDEDIRREIVRDVFLRLLWADPELVDVRVEDGVVTLSGRIQQRSQIALAVQLTQGVDGVVDVVNRLGFAVDDVTRRVPPAQF